MTKTHPVRKGTNENRKNIRGEWIFIHTGSTYIILHCPDCLTMCYDSIKLFLRVIIPTVPQVSGVAHGPLVTLLLDIIQLMTRPE